MSRTVGMKINDKPKEGKKQREEDFVPVDPGIDTVTVDPEDGEKQREEKKNGRRTEA